MFDKPQTNLGGTRLVPSGWVNWYVIGRGGGRLVVGSILGALVLAGIAFLLKAYAVH
jgi:hypothetical protein